MPVEPKHELRLAIAHVLFIDIVGYSKLLTEEQSEALQQLNQLVRGTRAFRAALATGSPPGGDKTELLPAWFRAHCPEIFEGAELDAQLRRAPLWLRLQSDQPERVYSRSK